MVIPAIKAHAVATERDGAKRDAEMGRARAMISLGPGMISPEMSALGGFVALAWLTFWAYWLVSASASKPGRRTMRGRPPELPPIALLTFVLLRLAGASNDLAVHSSVLRALGVGLLLCGLGFAVWARVHLGRNWGMPMTRHDDPELVTSGPYRLVRHPIYLGILLGVLGTALATNLYWLVALAIGGAYFIHSARVEERLMNASFPEAYASYRARSKMLIPFVL